MKLTTTTRTLAGLVAACKSAVATRTTKDVLKCVKLTAAGDGSVSAVATDMELHLTARAVDRVDRPGQCLLNHERLRAVLAVAPETDITLVQRDPTDPVKLTGKGIRYDLPALPVQEFPDAVTEGERCATATLPAAALLALFRRTAFAADHGGTGGKGAISGVLLELTPAALTATGTDSRRLSIASHPVTDGPAEPHAVVVPRAAVVALENALPASSSVTVTLGNQLTVRSERVDLVAATLHRGRAFNYADAFASAARKRKATAHVLPSELLDLCKRALAVDSDESRRLELTFSAGGITAAITTPLGAAELECGLSSFDGPDTKLAVNTLYLKDAAAALVADDRTAPVPVHLSGASPFYFDAGEFRHMISPLVDVD